MLVEHSISWNVSIGCDQRVHLWQLNKEYTTQTVFYLLTSFRHLFIILIRIFNRYNLMLFYAKWLLTSYQYNICYLHTGKTLLRLFKWIKCTFIILHFCWCFSHDLDMVEIEKWQLLDTRLNVQSTFALQHILTLNFSIFKD